MTYCPDKFGTYLSHPERLVVLLCNLGQRFSDIRRISPENFERNLFRIIQQKTGNKAIFDIDRYAIIPKLTYSLLKKPEFKHETQSRQL